MAAFNRAEKAWSVWSRDVSLLFDDTEIHQLVDEIMGLIQAAQGEKRARLISRVWELYSTLAHPPGADAPYLSITHESFLRTVLRELRTIRGEG